MITGPLPLPYVRVSNKVMNLTGGLQETNRKKQSGPRPRSMIDNEFESLRIKKGERSLGLKDSDSVVSKINSSLFGFDSKIQTLNTKLISKKSKPLQIEAFR
jgi:hypothetical protein